MVTVRLKNRKQNSLSDYIGLSWSRTQLIREMNIVLKQKEKLNYGGILYILCNCFEILFILSFLALTIW